MAFAVWAISQGTSCSQRCVPRATKAFLFELSENSPSCPFTQEHSEPPVAIVVKVFCSHRGTASSKEPQSPHSGIVSPLTHSSHRTRSTDFNSGPFFNRHMGPTLPQVCTHTGYVVWGCSISAYASSTHFPHTFLRCFLCTLLDHVCHCVRREGALHRHIATILVYQEAAPSPLTQQACPVCGSCQKSSPAPKAQFGNEF